MKQEGRLTALAALTAMALTVLFSVLGFSGSCEEVRGAVLRLHVIANSDSAADQALKLRVRDAILKQSGALFGSTPCTLCTGFCAGLEELGGLLLDDLQVPRFINPHRLSHMQLNHLSAGKVLTEIRDNLQNTNISHLGNQADDFCQHVITYQNSNLIGPFGMNRFYTTTGV